MKKLKTGMKRIRRERTENRSRRTELPDNLASGF